VPLSPTDTYRNDVMLNLKVKQVSYACPHFDEIFYIKKGNNSFKNGPIKML
jgi:hypothetical protein